MGVRDLINKKRTRLTLYLMSEGKGKTLVEIPEIPKERSQFLDTTDEWERVNFNKKAERTGCLFHAKEKNKFPSHIHDRREQITIMNRGGKFKYWSDIKGTGIVEFPNSIVFEKNEWHAVEWLSDTETLITWYPAFEKGWNAKIKED